MKYYCDVTDIKFYCIDKGRKGLDLFIYVNCKDIYKWCHNSDKILFNSYSEYNSSYEYEWKLHLCTFNSHFKIFFIIKHMARLPFFINHLFSSACQLHFINKSDVEKDFPTKKYTKTSLWKEYTCLLQLVYTNFDREHIFNQIG